MKFTVFYSITICLYLIITLLLVWKVIDIRRNPEKYARPALEQAGEALIQTKKPCWFFQSLSHQYSMISLLFMLLFNTLFYFLAAFLNERVFIGDRTSLEVGSALYAVLPAFFLSIFLGLAIIPLAIKTPFFEVATREIFNVVGRVATTRRAYTTFLAFFALLFPFMVQPISYYYCFDDAGIYYSEYFEFHENFLAYEDIEQVNIYIHHDNSEQIDCMMYEIEFGGKTKNINKPNQGAKYFTKEVLTVHEYIEKTDCIVHITPLTEADKLEMAEYLDEEQLRIVYDIFGETPPQE